MVSTAPPFLIVSRRVWSTDDQLVDLGVSNVSLVECQSIVGSWIYNLVPIVCNYLFIYLFIYFLLIYQGGTFQ